MKFFHLADLHIGKNVSGFPMLEDQIYILNQITELAELHKPDAVIIAGDVYDKSVPATDAVRAFDRFLTNLVRLKINVIIVSGNHDSPERIEFAGQIISDNGVYIYGVFDGSLHTVILNDDFGEVVFYLMPFIRPSVVRRFFDSQTEGYDDAVKAVVEASDIDISKRNVLITHQFFINPGTEPERSESEIYSIGGTDGVDIRIISSFDYAAIGHLHGAQKVWRDSFRYAGSPLKYSASECNHKKSVTMVELREKENISITHLPLSPLRDMRKIKGRLSELTKEKISAAANADDYIHVILTDDDEIVDAIGKIRSVYKNVMTLSFENRSTSAFASEDTALTLDAATPYELFEAFFFEQTGTSLNERHAAILDKLFSDWNGGYK